MNRQLYMGGGIMSLSKEGIGGGDYKGYDMGSRIGFGIVDDIKDLGKKAVGAVKDVVSSDIGKAALVGAGIYGLGGGFGGQFSSELLKSRAMSPFSFLGDKFSGITSSKIGKKVLGDKVGFGIGAASLLGGLAAKAEQGDESAIAATRNVESLKSYLTEGYRNLRSFTTPDGEIDEAAIAQQVEKDVSEYTAGQGGYAKGGRIGFAEGLSDEFMKRAKEVFNERQRGLPEIKETKETIVDLNDFNLDAQLQRAKELAKEKGISVDDAFGIVLSGGPFIEDPMTDPVKLIKDKKAKGGRMKYANGTMSPEEYFKGKEKFMKQKQMEDMIREYENYLKGQNMKRDEVAKGGRMKYAMGTDEKVDQASGIMGLPKRINKAGVKELDLRKSGGFIPPVGVKEKADDIPAMLSNNEFVFTADAVRGAGDGDVELGAQRMYDAMKKYENKVVRV